MQDNRLHSSKAGAAVVGRSHRQVNQERRVISNPTLKYIVARDTELRNLVVAKSEESKRVYNFTKRQSRTPEPRSPKPTGVF